VFQLHGETVQLTPAMQLLGSGKWCKNQIVQVAPFAWGMQCHPEITPKMLDDVYPHDALLQQTPLATLHAQYNQFQVQLNTHASALFTNFLKICGFES
jgi:GMP synthase (glutamine-hydrolysing)